MTWLLFGGPIWAAIGAYVIPRRYRNQGLDDSQKTLVGVLGGLIGGPFVLRYLWGRVPPIDAYRIAILWTGTLAVLIMAFALGYPDNLCVTNHTYVPQQFLNGLTIGVIYALMAVGLTLIYSIQGIVSFTHGQFYMIGG